MTLSAWLSLALVCLLGAMSPGPSLAVMVRNTLLHGVGGGIVAATAHGLGVALYAIAVVSGLALVVTSSPILFAAIQWSGAAFLVYLGANSLLSRGTETLVADEPAARRPNAAVREGFLVAFLNPKLAIFFLALFSQFLTADTTLLQKAIMVVTVGVTDSAWYMLIAILLARPTVLDWLRSSQRLIDRVFGVLLIALAIRVVVPF